MYGYIKGIITEIESGFIILDNNGIGYLINVANPYYYNINQEVKMYIYQSVKEDDISLFGFKNYDEKDLFLRLIGVKGIGAKMALPFLAGSINAVIDAIDRENILYLKKFPKVGDKVARQIILDLKGKLTETKVADKVNDELVEALQALGYKQVNINKILKNIDYSESIETQIKTALKLLMK